MWIDARTIGRLIKSISHLTISEVFELFGVVVVAIDIGRGLVDKVLLPQPVRSNELLSSRSARIEQTREVASHCNFAAK